MRDTWLNVRCPVTGKLLFKYDPHSRRVHFKRGPIDVIVRLQDYDLEAGIVKSVNGRQC
jgi:hypothetical protein